MSKQQESPETTFTTDQSAEILEFAREVLASEAGAITEAARELTEAFPRAVQAILNCPGRVCVTGMGKAGVIGRKIQATLASTGTLAYSLHPVEALHGDLGMVHPEDIVIALSRSGGSEISQLVPLLKKIGCAIILLTGETESTTAQYADFVLSIGNAPEACPLGLAPSSSTAAMLALGDALALAVMKQKAIKPEQYAANHPGGALGRALMKVRDIMRTGENCPCVSPATRLAQCYEAMLRAPLRAGAAIVVDDSHLLAGILTQGDVFRLIAKKEHDVERPVGEIMTRSPKHIDAEQPALDALALMRRFSIDELPVVDNSQKVVGLLDIQDLIRHGFPIAESTV